MNKTTLAALLGTSQAQWMSHFKHANASNPFNGKTLFANPLFTSEVKTAEAAYPSEASEMRTTEHTGAANWIDSMSKISSVEPILKAAQASGELPMFVIYDLPNRDCDALASNGEILCEDSNCTNGLNTYKTQYVDRIVEIFKKYPDVPVVAIIEPDSLPNLATNLSNPKCQQAEKAYKEGVSYTLTQIAALGNVTSYLDAGHGGWLGWANNLAKIGPIFKEVLSNAGGDGAIRGFVTNTANYQPLGSMTNTSDPCSLKSQYNFAIDEIHYISLLDKALQKAGVFGMSYITDTSRNGQTDERRDCSDWCNIKGAGLGVRPTTDVSQYGLSNLDALVWVKTPGESDGTSNQNAKRHDQHCNSADSFIPSPEAGQFSTAIYDMLVKNANPPLGKNEMQKKIKFATPEELAAHVANTPLGKQAQKYNDLWANQQQESKLANEQIILKKTAEYDMNERDVGKNAFYQQTLMKQKQADKEDQWKIIAEKNAQFMKSVQQNSFKEADARKQYLSKQAGYQVMQTAIQEFESKEAKALNQMRMQEHQEILGASKEVSLKQYENQTRMQDHQQILNKSKEASLKQYETLKLMKEHQDAMRASRAELAKEPKAEVFDMQAQAQKARSGVFDMQAQAQKARAEAKVVAQESARTAYKAKSYAAKKASETFWTQAEEHNGYMSRDQFISNGPAPTTEQAAANQKYQEAKAIKASHTKSDPVETQRDVNRRRAMEYAKQQAYVQGKSATFYQH